MLIYSTFQVYDVLDKLFAEVKFLVENSDWMEHMGPFSENIITKELTSLKQDLDYLTTMKEMDEQIEERRLRTEGGDGE